MKGAGYVRFSEPFWEDIKEPLKVDRVYLANHPIPKRKLPIKIEKGSILILDGKSFAVTAVDKNIHGFYLGTGLTREISKRYVNERFLENKRWRLIVE